MRKVYYSILFLVLSITSKAQVSLSNGAPTVTIDFTGYAGGGFQPTPSASQLDSDSWATTGWSDGALAFGGTNTTGDHARGNTAAAVLTGGFYAYTGGAAAPTFLIQPGGADWAPGTLSLRLVNNGSTTLTEIAVSYNIYVRNDQGRSNSFNFSHSADHVTYTPVGALDYTSPAALDALGMVLAGSRSTTITGLSIAPGSFYYIRWSGADVGGSGSRDEFGLDDISITGTFAGGTPSVAISAPVIGASTESQGATNVILQRYDLAVTTASATLTGLTINTGGSYLASDITNLKVRYSTDATLDGADATLSTLAPPATAGAQVFTPFTSQAVAAGNTGYFFITADISATAVPGNTINVAATPFSGFTFSGSVTTSGTDPVAAAGLKTIAALAPDITITGASPAAGNINQNTTNNIIYSIQLDVAVNNSTLNGISFTTGGTYTVADLQANGFSLWINSTNSLTGATQIGSDQPNVGPGGTVSFSPLSTVINSGTTRYLLLTADVAFNATGGNIINITSSPFSNIVFATGNKLGTDPVAAGNDQTITTVTPAITITQTGPAASNAAAGATNVFLYQFNGAVTLNHAVLNSVTVTTAGTYLISDLVAGSFKLWFNTANNFGTATQISSTAIVGSGSNIVFSGLTQQINAGSSGFFWITSDVAAGATAGNTINITSTPLSNIVFASATLSGADPMAAGGVRTFVMVPLPGEVVINQFSADYNAATDEYIELVNKTNKSFDLSLLRITYQSAGGSGGGAGGILSGTLPPYGYWLLSPNATVTVGLTSVARDGAITSGFAAADGQLALQVISGGATIDGLAYGSITVNNLGEGTASASPPNNGGLKRNEGDDSNNNSADFATVSTANIDLRNSSSRLLQTGANLPGPAYTRVYVKGNSTLTGATTLSERIELLSGSLTLGTNNLTTSNTAGGNSTNYIVTNSTGTLTVTNITGTSKSFPVGNSTYNPISIINGSGFDWTVRVEDALNNVVPPFTTDKAINRTWHISPSSTVITGPDVTFGFDDSDPNQLANPGAYNDAIRDAQFWHYTGSEWLAASGAVPMTPAPGVQSITLQDYLYYSPFAIAKINGPLPVKFADIRAYQQGSGIRVDWSNMSESDVVNYKVERSVNGIDFAALGTVAANRNDGGRANYSFFDAFPADGINYYRIQSLEVDGRKLNSMIVRVNTRAGVPEITVFPNPVTNGQLSFQAQELIKGDYTLRIFNTGGQQVFTKSVIHTGGALSELVQLPGSMKPGVYNLIISSGEMKLTKSFIIR